MQNLSGWWRLWILSMLAWTAGVAGCCYAYWPSSPQAVHDPAFIDQLARSQRTQLAGEDEASDGFHVRMPNGHILRFKPDVEQEAAEKVAGAYHNISVRAQEQFIQLRSNRFLVIALLPALAVALLGIGVAWVRRGFGEHKR